MKNGNIKIFFAAKTKEKEIRGFVNLDSITPEKLEDMKLNRKNYVGKVIIDKKGILYRVIDTTDKGFICRQVVKA